jgi:hypothetical protein
VVVSDGGVVSSVGDPGVAPGSVVVESGEAGGGGVAVSAGAPGSIVVVSGVVTVASSVVRVPAASCFEHAAVPSTNALAMRAIRALVMRSPLLSGGQKANEHPQAAFRVANRQQDKLEMTPADRGQAAAQPSAILRHASCCGRCT